MGEKSKLVKEFDKKLIEQQPLYEVSKIGAYFLFILGAFISCISLGRERVDFKLSVIVEVVMGLAIFFYLSGYMSIQEGGKNISIYEKIKYLPVSVNVFFYQRFLLLSKLCLKQTLLMLGFQILVATITGNYIFYNLKSTLVIMLVIWIIETGYIYPWRSRRTT